MTITQTTNKVKTIHMVRAAQAEHEAKPLIPTVNLVTRMMWLPTDKTDHKSESVLSFPLLPPDPLPVCFCSLLQSVRGEKVKRKLTCSHSARPRTHRPGEEAMSASAKYDSGRAKDGSADRHFPRTSTLTHCSFPLAFLLLQHTVPATALQL